MFGSPMSHARVASVPVAYVTKTGVVLDGAPDAAYSAASSRGAFEGLTFDGLCYDPDSPERRIARARADAAAAHHHQQQLMRAQLQYQQQQQLQQQQQYRRVESPRQQGHTACVPYSRHGHAFSAAPPGGDVMDSCFASTFPPPCTPPHRYGSSRSHDAVPMSPPARSSAAALHTQRRPQQPPQQHKQRVGQGQGQGTRRHMHAVQPRASSSHDPPAGAFEVSSWDGLGTGAPVSDVTTPPRRQGTLHNSITGGDADGSDGSDAYRTPSQQRHRTAGSWERAAGEDGVAPSAPAMAVPPPRTPTRAGPPPGLSPYVNARNTAAATAATAAAASGVASGLARGSSWASVASGAQSQSRAPSGSGGTPATMRSNRVTSSNRNNSSTSDESVRPQVGGNTSVKATVTPPRPHAAAAVRPSFASVLQGQHPERGAGTARSGGAAPPHPPPTTPASAASVSSQSPAAPVSWAARARGAVDGSGGNRRAWRSSSCDSASSVASYASTSATGGVGGDHESRSSGRSTGSNSVVSSHAAAPGASTGARSAALGVRVPGAAATAATSMPPRARTRARSSSSGSGVGGGGGVPVGAASPGGLRARRDGEVSIFVGNLPWSVTQPELERMFADYAVDYAHLEIGRKGKSRGWGIVRVTDPSLAARIIGEKNGLQVGNRCLVVREDLPRDAPGVASSEQQGAATGPQGPPQRGHQQGPHHTQQQQARGGSSGRQAHNSNGNGGNGNGRKKKKKRR